MENLLLVTLLNQFFLPSASYSRFTGWQQQITGNDDKQKYSLPHIHKKIKYARNVRNSGTRRMKTIIHDHLFEAKSLSNLSITFKLPLINRQIINRMTTLLLICQIAHSNT